MTDTEKRPPLLDLVERGRSERVAVEDFIFLSRDVSNSHLITTAEGDVLVNAGTAARGEAHRELYADSRTGPLRFAVITQGHPDHFGGLASLKEPGTRGDHAGTQRRGAGVLDQAPGLLRGSHGEDLVGARQAAR